MAQGKKTAVRGVNESGRTVAGPYESIQAAADDVGVTPGKLYHSYKVRTKKCAGLYWREASRR